VHAADLKQSDQRSRQLRKRPAVSISPWSNRWQRWGASA